MRKQAGFTAAGCLLLMALGCGVCALFSGGDIGPVSVDEAGIYLMLKLAMALIAAGLTVAALVAAVIAIQAKETPRRRVRRSPLRADSSSTVRSRNSQDAL